MSRDPLQSVTLPVIVKARRLEDADGWCFPNARDSFAVQVVKAEDVQRRLRQIFSPEDVFLFTGIKQLKTAHDSQDARATLDAIEKVQPWTRGPLTLSTPKGTNWIGVRWVYSNLMSKLLEGPRLVMWCSDKEGTFLPGVYCPDWRAAAFVLLFMDSIRVCPKCGNSFIPKTDNQDYCTPAHGVAHRTARSRWNAKQRAEAKSRK